MVHTHAGRRVSYLEKSIGRSIREIRDAASSLHSILGVGELARARSLAEKIRLLSYLFLLVAHLLRATCSSSSSPSSSLVPCSVYSTQLRFAVFLSSFSSSSSSSSSFFFFFFFPLSACRRTAPHTVSPALSPRALSRGTAHTRRHCP